MFFVRLLMLHISEEMVFECRYRAFGRVKPMVMGRRELVGEVFVVMEPIRALEILLSRNCSCGVMPCNMQHL